MAARWVSEDSTSPRCGMGLMNWCGAKDSVFARADQAKSSASDPAGRSPLLAPGSPHGPSCRLSTSAAAGSAVTGHTARPRRSCDQISTTTIGTSQRDTGYTVTAESGGSNDSPYSQCTCTGKRDGKAATAALHYIPMPEWTGNFQGSR